MKIVASRHGKPDVAVIAENIADEIDHFFEVAEPLNEELPDYLTSEELQTLMDASSILRDFDMMYSTDHR